MKKETARRISLYVDGATYKEFQILAIKLGKSVSELVEQFMKQEISNGK